MPGLLGAEQPIDYSIKVDNPTQAFTQGLTAGQSFMDNRLKQAATAQGLQMQQQLNQDTAAVAANPTTEGIIGLAIKHPQLAAGFISTYEAMTKQQQTAKLEAITPVIAALHGGNFETAAQVVDRQTEGYKNAGDSAKAASSQALADLIRKDPAKALTMLGVSVAGALGPEKYVENFGNMAKAPGEIAKATAEGNVAQQTVGATVAQKAAEASKAQAEAAQTPEQLELARQNTASQMAERKLRLAFDQNKLETETKVQREKIEAEFGALKGDALTKSNASTETSVQAKIDADRYAGLATNADNATNWTGFAGKGIDAWKHIFGSEDAYTEFKNDYNRARVQAIVGSIPKGAGTISDKDIELYKSGIPEANANPQTIANFLRATARVKFAESNIEDAKAQWMAANNGMLAGPTKKDFAINGTKIAAGTQFNKFIKDYLGPIMLDYSQSLATKKVTEKDFYKTHSGE